MGDRGESTTPPTAEPAAPTMKFLFRIEAQVGPPVESGSAGGVSKRMIPIIGGKVSGPVLEGVVLPGGADWQTVRTDGTSLVRARYLIRSSSGATIEVDNPGIRRGPPELMNRLLAGEPVDPALYYFRTAPRFTTSAPEYAFLMDFVCVCSGERRRDAAILRVYAIL